VRRNHYAFHIPSFSQTFFHTLVNIEEEKPAGTKVKRLPVLDEDRGKNGEFDCTYENIQPAEFGKFRVLTTTTGCEIQNKILLKWFEGNSYTLRVRVTDRASPLVRKSDVITVRIKVRWFFIFLCVWVRFKNA
jgi:hypothetical protein